MKRKYHRVGFTALQSAELWERWKKGEGLHAIGRVLGKPHSCIFNHLRPSGGIMPPAKGLLENGAVFALLESAFSRLRP